MKKVWIGCVVAILIVVVALFLRGTRQSEVTIGGTSIKVDIANTSTLREQGLSGRTELSDGYGMLFVFDTPGQYGFWMKDMNFPIDIVWINAKMQIIGVENSVSPTTYPTVFYPKEPVLYVLELPAGYVLERHIDMGSEVLLGL